MSASQHTPSPEEEQEILRETGSILESFTKQRSSLIPALQAVQEKLGYLPGPALLAIAEYLDIPAIDVYSVVTFYNQFRLNPPGRHSIHVCLGTACHMKGGTIALDAWKRRLGIDVRETTADREYDLDTVACVGCCSMAPVTVVDGTPEAGVDPTRVDGLMLAFEQEGEKRNSTNLEQGEQKKDLNDSSA